MATRGRQKKQKLRERREEEKSLFDELDRMEREHKGKNDLPCHEDMTRLALQSQGQHEADIIFYNEGDLHNTFIICNKNKSHVGFIPVPELNLKSLPLEFQNRDIYDCVRLLVSLAVKLTVISTSENRPDGYDFCNWRGRSSARHVRCGSGSVFIPRKKPKSHSCPCKTCKQSSKPSSTWYFVWVSTAHHVVFDNSEAEDTEVEMFYDDGKNTSSIRKLRGLRLVNCDQDSDRCILECVTHDDEIYRKIRNARWSLRNKERKLNEKYSKEVARTGHPPLAVVVSHPHGTAKQVSFGTCVVKRHIKTNCQSVEWTEYLYDAATCNGSSGALVWLLGQERVGYRDHFITTHTHSGHKEGSINKSGGGLDFITQRGLARPTSHL